MQVSGSPDTEGSAFGKDSEEVDSQVEDEVWERGGVPGCKLVEGGRDDEDDG